MEHNISRTTYVSTNKSTLVSQSINGTVNITHQSQQFVTVSTCEPEQTGCVLWPSHVRLLKNTTPQLCFTCRANSFKTGNISGWGEVSSAGWDLTPTSWDTNVIYVICAAPFCERTHRDLQLLMLIWWCLSCRNRRRGMQFWWKARLCPSRRVSTPPLTL